MNKTNLRILAVVAVALLLALFALQTGDDDTSAGDELLFPQLKSRINDLSNVTITLPGEEAPTIVKKEADRWIVASREGYAADLGKLRELLLALADAKIVEKKTSDPELHERLGVRDPSVAGSKGILLELQGADATYRLIVGNAAQAGYRYVRVADDPQSWLIDKNPQIPATPGDWLLDNIVDIKSDAVRSVTITHPDGEEIHIARESSDETDFDVLNIPDARELSYATVADGIAGALNALSLDDVRKGGDLAEDAVTTTFDTFDGVQLVVRAARSEDETWISLRATEIEQQQGEDPADAAQDETDETADDEESEVKESAADINARVEGWQYKIPEYKANQLTRRWDDILKDESE